MLIDTNVLVYIRVQSAPAHESARRALDEAMNRREPLRISRQIMREYLAVMTRPQTWASPLSMVEATADPERFERQLVILEDGPTVTRALIGLCRTVPLAGRQVHDANIVATMLAHSEARLLTANIADFRRFQPMIEIVGL